jgi:hypothetical protein
MINVIQTCEKMIFKKANYTHLRIQKVNKNFSTF